ncbi:MAG: DinB family protein [Acidimicrobiales bacterium]
MGTAPAPALAAERADLLQTLATHRGFLRHTVRDLTDEQGRQRPTVSVLCLGGIIKHVADVESSWARFILEGPEALTPGGQPDPGAWETRFQMLPDETLAGILERYAEIAARTDHLVATYPDLDESQPLPVAPWFEPGARRSARRVLLHIVAETAQHAGHADILREAIDGSKTMG